MRQYKIDELRANDFQKLKDYLDHHLISSTINGIYKIELPIFLLKPIQKEHKECQPFYFCLHLEENSLSLELLIRSAKKIRCNCIDYANANQRDWALDFLDSILESLKINV